MLFKALHVLCKVPPDSEAITENIERRKVTENIERRKD